MELETFDYDLFERMARWTLNWPEVNLKMLYKDKNPADDILFVSSPEPDGAYFLERDRETGGWM